eukprot:gene4099-2945_t
MFFCPFCGTLLLFSLERVGEGRFFCTTCPYVVPVQEEQVLTVTHDFRSPEDEKSEAAEPPAPEVEDVKKEANIVDDAGQVISIPCENVESGCQSQKAYYVQTQIRSADEPATIFYKCVECGHTWRQD